MNIFKTINDVHLCSIGAKDIYAEKVPDNFEGKFEL